MIQKGIKRRLAFPAKVADVVVETAMVKDLALVRTRLIINRKLFISDRPKRELYARAVRRVNIRFSIHRQYLQQTGILKCLSQQNPGITVQTRYQQLFPMEHLLTWKKTGLQVLHLRQEKHLKSI